MTLLTRGYVRRYVAGFAGLEFFYIAYLREALRILFASGSIARLLERAELEVMLLIIVKDNNCLSGALRVRDGSSRDRFRRVRYP